MIARLRKRVGSQIYAAYFVILFLLVVITAGAWLRLNQIEDNVDHFADEVAENLILAAEVEAQILRVRDAANVYIRSQRERDLNIYRVEFAELGGLLAEAEEQIREAEQRAFLENAIDDAEAFNVNFEAIHLALLEREALRDDVLHPTEIVILDEIGFLEAGASQRGNDSHTLAIQSLKSAIGQLHLNTEQYLIDFQPTVRSLIGESIGEAEEILPRIEMGLEGGEEMAALGRIDESLKVYEAGFSDLAAVTQEMISRQAQLTQLEPLFVNDIHELVNVTRDELTAENKDTKQLVTQSRWLMVVAAFAAAVVGFAATNQFARRARLSVKQAISEAQLASERALTSQLTDENLRMNAELDVTRRLQSLLLPASEELRAIPNLDVAGFMEPANEVGGDYYDVLSRNGRLKIGIGDVTGHGLESGVMMLMTQSAVRALLNAGLQEPGHFMDVVNETIFENARRMRSDRTMTLSLLDYAPAENGRDGNSLTVSGYHEEVIIVRRDRRVERIDTTELGVPVGLVADTADLVSETRIELKPGDGAALYTDGITEAQNEAGGLYGLDRLCRRLSENWHQSSAEIIEAIVADIREFTGEKAQFDDVTLVVLKQK